MTKEEVETHCGEIIKWLKSQQPRMPRAYIGTVSVPVSGWCSGCDDFMMIIIDNSRALQDGTGLRVWFATTADECHNHECYGAWELNCGLNYKCALVANWKIVKQKINDLIEGCISSINHTAEQEARMCAKITEFEL